MQLGSQLIITLSPYSYLQEIQHKIVYRSNLCLAIFLMFVGASQNLFCILAQIRFCLKCLWSCRPFLSRDHIDHIDNSHEHLLVLLPFPSPTVFTFSKSKSKPEVGTFLIINWIAPALNIKYNPAFLELSWGQDKTCINLIGWQLNGLSIFYKPYACICLIHPKHQYH